MKLLITGATGLVGDAVLRLSLQRPDILSIVSVGRRMTGLSSPKLTEVAVEDFLNLAPARPHLAGVDVCIHCLAAYRGRVGGQAYQQITIGYLDALIREMEIASPEMAFCYFSAEGARRDGRSSVPALNVKGRAERRVSEARFPRKYFFRPGYIRPSRPRANPVFYDPLMTPVFRLVPTIGIESSDLARAMIETGLNDPRPEAILGNREMRALCI